MNEIKEDESEQKSGLIYNLKTISLIFAFLSSFIPMLVIMGYYYEFGWLTGFGVDSSLINTSINNLLLSFYHMLTGVWGYEDKLLIASFFSIVFFVVLVIVSYVAILIVGYLTREIQGLIRKYIKWERKKNEDLKITIFYSSLLSFLPFVIFYIVVFIALPGRVAFELGLYKAKNVIKSYQSCKKEYYLSWETCVEFIDTNNTSYKGYLVFNNGGYIVLYNEKTTIIDKKTGNKIIRKRLKGKVK